MAGTREFQAVLDSAGRPIDGLLECEICRVERVEDGLWCAEVPMRSIGASAYKEFRPLSMGGHWVPIGRFTSPEQAWAMADRFRYGELVFDSAVSRNGQPPARLVLFTAVADELSGA